MKKCLIAVLMFSTLMATSALAGGDAAAGKAKSTTCIPCHGKHGISKMGLYPNLAGQKVKYMVNQMKMFKSGKRQNPMMRGQMKKLSEADMLNLAQYYSGLGG